MKNIFAFVALGTLALGSMSARAADTGIYGWNIKCVGERGLVAVAYQSDDDFYIEYQSADIRRTKVWADAENEFDLTLSHLHFNTDQSVSKGPNVSLQILRRPSNRFEYAQGEIQIENERFNLNCFVRFAPGEDDMDKVENMPWPAIAVPRN